MGDVLGDLGCDGFAGAAPCCEGVDDDDGVGGDGLAELLESAGWGFVSGLFGQGPAAPKLVSRVGMGGAGDWGGTELGATHEAMLWTVMLGELVVNCLDGVPRRVLKAGRRSLDVIGNEWGAWRRRETRFMKAFERRSRDSFGGFWLHKMM